MNFATRRVFSSGAKSAGRIFGGSAVVLGAGTAAYLHFVDPTLPQTIFGNQPVKETIPISALPPKTTSLQENASRLRAEREKRRKKEETEKRRIEEEEKRRKYEEEQAKKEAEELEKAKRLEEEKRLSMLRAEQQKQDEAISRLETLKKEVEILKELEDDQEKKVEVLKELEADQEKKMEQKLVEVMEKRLDTLKEENEAFSVPEEEEQDTLTRLISTIQTLKKENAVLKKQKKKATKQAEKYQSFLQEKLVPLQKGKETYEKAVERYRELEEDMAESYAIRNEQLRYQTEQRVEELVDVQKKMKAFEFVLADLKEEQDRRNEMLRVHSMVQIFEDKIQTGDKFSEELAKLCTVFEKDRFVSLVLSQIDTDTASNGFPTVQELLDSFVTLEKRSRQAILTRHVPDGTFAKKISWFLSWFLVPEPALREDESDANARLSNASFYVGKEKFADALEELQAFEDVSKLEGEAMSNLHTWSKQVKSKLVSEEVLKVLKSYMLLQADPTIV